MSYNKSESDVRFIQKTEADSKYLTIPVADSKYITQGMADGKYMTFEGANTRFLTPDVADAKYLTKTVGDSLYLTPTIADTRYMKSTANVLTKEIADKTYLPNTSNTTGLLTKADADKNYVSKVIAQKFITQTDADSKYLTPAIATSMYLTRVEADQKYLPTSTKDGFVTLVDADRKYFKTDLAKNLITKAEADQSYLSSKTDFLSGNAAKEFMKKTEAANVFVSRNENITIPKEKNIEFGYSEKKEKNAGVISYSKFSNALDIVGAGEAVGYRNVKIWDNLEVPGEIKTSANSLITTPGWIGPYNIEFYAVDEPKCLDVKQFKDNMGGTDKCDSESLNQEFYYNSITGQLKNVVTGLCLEKGDDMWSMKQCSDSENQQLTKFEHSLKWRNQNCFDSENLKTRNNICNNTPGQQMKFIYSKKQT